MKNCSLLWRISRLASWLLWYWPGAVSWADTPAIPVGWPASRYESLWLHSPFIPSSVPYDSDSAEFELVGLGRLDEEVYASILEKQSGQVFVLSNNRPSHGLRLLKVHRGPQPEDCSAIIGKEDQMLTLHLRPATSQAPDAALPTPPLPRALAPEALSPNALTPHSLLPPTH